VQMLLCQIKLRFPHEQIMFEASFPVAIFRI
jgi:hypothetical protein